MSKLSLSALPKHQSQRSLISAIPCALPFKENLHITSFRDHVISNLALPHTQLSSARFHATSDTQCIY